MQKNITFSLPVTSNLYSCNKTKDTIHPDVHCAERIMQMEMELLVRQAMRGSKEAFLELMLMHQEYLYRTAFLYTKNQDMACDVVQECIIKSMVSIDKLKQPAFFKTWLTRILINCAITELRKNKMYIGEEDWDSYKDDPVSKEEKLDLYQAIDRLAFPYKVIIIQKYFFGYRLQEIADFLQMPLGTIKAYHSKAKDQLKEYLETKETLETENDERTGASPAKAYAGVHRKEKRA